MSYLFRKEALENRSRALYGEVILRGPVKSWILTALILLVFIISLIMLFGLKIETENGHVSLFTWIMSPL